MNLMEAAEKGDAVAVKKALDARSSRKPQSGNESEYRMALQKACQYGQTDVVEQLLQVGTHTGVTRSREMSHLS